MRQYARITRETTYGVYAAPSSGALGTDYIIPRLHQSNSLGGRPDAQRWEIRAFDGLNRRIQTGSGKTAIALTLNTLFYPSQAAFLTEWGLVLNGSDDLMSCTIDHAIEMGDNSNTIVYRRYLGCKIGTWHLSGDSNGQIFTLTLNIVAKAPATITISDFAEPAESLFPSDSPYIFQQMDSPGLMTLQNAGEPEFSNFDFTVTNMLDGTFNQSQYITRCKWCGRNVEWTNRVVYQNATYRTNYEAVSPQICKARIDNGTHHVIFDFQGANHQMSPPGDDLGLDKVFYQELKWAAFLDMASAKDLDVTVT